MVRVRPALFAIGLSAIVGASGCAGEIGSGTGANPGTGGTGSTNPDGSVNPTGAGGNGGSNGSGTGGDPQGGAGTGGPIPTGQAGGGGTTVTGAAGTTGVAGTTGAAATTGAAGTTAGTTGGAGTTGSGGTMTVMPPPSTLPAEKACSSNVPGPRLLRRLTAVEFAATIRTLFNDPSVPIAGVFSDPSVLGFQVDANALLVQELNASQLMDNAEAIAAWAASSMNRLTAFSNCSTKDATCGRSFVKAFGSKAFRTNLADSDPRVTSYLNLFNAETTYVAGAQTVIAAMLQAPSFLYRSELGTGSGTNFNLSPYEVATNLAYLLTGTMPDDTLLSAAGQVVSGSLTMTAMLDQQASRLLSAGDARSQYAVMEFMTGWLGLDRLYTTAKDDTVFALTKPLRDAMATETRSLVMEAFTGGGNLGSLLTADHTYLNRDLATFYGLPTANLGTSFTRVTLTSSMPRDAGLLAHGSILIGYSRPDISSPTLRGLMVRRRMLCQDVPPPPANLDTILKPPAAGVVTTRQHYEVQHGVGVCASCHQYMDPIGFGFESYDGFGRYRTTENGAPIDDSGKLVAVSTQAGSPTFTGLGGPGSLGAWLAQSPEVNQCMVRYWAYRAYGSSSWAQDACTYTSIRNEAAASNYALKNVLMAIIHAPHFTRRVKDQ